jgi:hypothetical protein
MDCNEINRRSLLKLIALASPAFFASPSESLETNSDQRRLSLASPRRSRPRIFYDAATLLGLRQSLSSNTANGIALRRRGEQLLRAEFFPESIAEIGGGQQANYNTAATQVADMNLTLGLLYHLTGEERYAAKLREALLYYGNYVRWTGPGLAARVPPWHSVLETTNFSLGYSAGYDALHDFLTETDRQAIADIMLRLAVEPILNDWILPGKRIHSLDSMGHNWWGVCVAGAGLCALTLLGDDPRAQSWIDAIDAGYLQWFKYSGNVLQNRMCTFERTGPSYEGVGYTNYGISQYLHYRFAWQNVFPDRKWPRIEPLEHISSYFLQTLYPTSSGFLTVNLEDSGLEADSSATLLLLIACGVATSEATRYLALVNSRTPDTLLTLVQQHPRPADVKDPPTSCIYPHMGWAILRSSWEPDATLLAMKSGYTWNHAHADASTFILFKNGKPLVIDSGTCNYSRPEYTSYYSTSLVHNVIVFNGEGQSQDDTNLGCKFPGQMHVLMDGLGLKYVYADATGPMARWFVRNYRHWLWSGDLILIFDDIRAHDAWKMEWLLHYDGESSNDVAGGVRLKNGAAEVLVKMLYPASTITTNMGLADHDPDKKVPYLVFHPDGLRQVQQFITAICLNPASSPAFKVQDDPNFLHLQITNQDAIEELYLSRRAIATPGTMCINADGFTTDAYMVHIRRVGAQPERYFVVDGSYLRRGTQSLMSPFRNEMSAGRRMGRSKSFQASKLFRFKSERSISPLQCPGTAGPCILPMTHKRNWFLSVQVRSGAVYDVR